MRWSVLALGLCLLSSGPALAADPTGRYSVAGTNPDGAGRYQGTVEVTRTGETYRVVWNVGGQRYVGTGIGNDGLLAVSYQSGRVTGIAVYAEKGGSWSGPWTSAGGSTTGTERWTRE